MRCDWAKKDIEIAYHDKEWGKELHDERKLFEMLSLELMQAGLSWHTILKKREAFKKAFDDFHPEIIKDYNEEKIKELLENKEIIRNKRKIHAIINNAKAYFILCKRYESLDNFLWRYVDYKPVVNSYKEINKVPAETKLSERISEDLKKLGFQFVGPIIVYSYLQAIGIVNDHMDYCDFKYMERTTDET